MENEDQTLVNIETGEIKWDKIKEILKEQNESNPIELKCKRCGYIFRTKKYIGKNPLCKKCR